jgi:chemotaxis protein MotA
MATALITTFYGAVLANLVFMPIAGKLRLRSAHELLLKELCIQGIMAIQSGDNPRIVESKLKAFLSPSKRGEFKREE